MTIQATHRLVADWAACSSPATCRWNQLTVPQGTGPRFTTRLPGGQCSGIQLPSWQAVRTKPLTERVQTDAINCRKPNHPASISKHNITLENGLAMCETAQFHSELHATTNNCRPNYLCWQTCHDPIAASVRPSSVRVRIYRPVHNPRTAMPAPPSPPRINFHKDSSGRQQTFTHLNNLNPWRCSALKGDDPLQS